MSGFGGKSGRRGGSERKKKAVFTPNLAPGAVPTTAPELRQHAHTSNPHAHTTFTRMLAKRVAKRVDPATISNPGFGALEQPL